MSNDSANEVLKTISYLFITVFGGILAYKAIYTVLLILGGL